MENRRICKKCLLQDFEGEEREKWKKYLEVIKKEDRTKQEVYEERLNTCRACGKLLEATCEACGCYVEFRAAVKPGRCPYKKWPR